MFSSSETGDGVPNCRYTVLAQQLGSIIKGDFFGFDRLFLRRLTSWRVGFSEYSSIMRRTIVSMASVLTGGCWGISGVSEQ